MIKEHSRAFCRLIIIVDFLLITAAAAVTYAVRRHAVGYHFNAAYDYLSVLPVYLALWFVLLRSFGVYRSARVRSSFFLISGVIKATVLTFVVFITLIYFAHLDLGRNFVFFSVLSAGILLIIEKTLLMRLFHSLRRKGLNTRNILLIGSRGRAQRFIDLLEDHKEWGLRIAGLVDNDRSLLGSSVKGYRIIGTFEDIPSILADTVIDEVVFVTPLSWAEKLDTIMRYCETVGVKVHVAVDYLQLRFSMARATDLGGFPMLTFGSVSDRVGSLMIKRVIDVLVSSAILILFSPFLFIIAVLIKLDSSGPVFFRQKRVSLNGRTFDLYKFRTMVPDAEELKARLMEKNEMQGPAFKIEDDPRVTKLGRILRKTSIDEFPQFWNVLVGDMSIVGPRPPLPDEVCSYDSWHRRRLSMRPGITCIWQVSGRNRIKEFDQWVELDLKYIDNWSLMLDMKIFFKTIYVVLLRIGAR